jgi:hypothetical protein
MFKMIEIVRLTYETKSRIVLNEEEYLDAKENIILKEERIE